MMAAALKIRMMSVTVMIKTVSYVYTERHTTFKGITVSKED